MTYASRPAYDFPEDFICFLLWSGHQKGNLKGGKGWACWSCYAENSQTQTSIRLLANYEEHDVPCELPCLMSSYWVNSSQVTWAPEWLFISCVSDSNFSATNKKWLKEVESTDVRTLGHVERDVIAIKEAKPYWYLYSGHKSVPSFTYKNLAVKRKGEIIPLTIK